MDKKKNTEYVFEYIWKYIFGIFIYYSILWFDDVWFMLIYLIIKIIEHSHSIHGCLQFLSDPG